MSVQRQSSTPDEADLESTAELPVLDVAAFEATAAADPQLGSTDTWIIPPPGARGATGPAAASADDARIQLENDLRTLSADLRELEERLTRKSERLAEIEIALQAARAERLVAAQRAERLTQELAEARAALRAEKLDAGELQRAIAERDAAKEALKARDDEFATQFAAHDRVLALVQQDLSEAQARAALYLETLQYHESRRTVVEGVLSSQQVEVDEREARLTQFQRELAISSARSRELQSELSERSERIVRLEKEVNALAAALAQRDEQLRKSEHAGDELRRRVDSLTETVAARTERVRTLEAAAARQNQSSSQRQSELDRAIAQRTHLVSRAATLESSLAAATARGEEREKAAQQARSRCEELEKLLATQRRCADQLEAELATVRGELQEWGAALQEAGAQRNEHMAHIAASEARIEELEERVAEQQETVRVLQADANANVARAKELESDLRAAEDTIHRLESDLRGKTARLDELEKTHGEWRLTVEEARQALTDRDSLIHRLEEEAANSTVLLGDIQQSMKRMDPSGSGSFDAMPDGATRLLIRTDADSEVVHVLSRKTSVGRTPDNDLQIDAKFISRHHAVILAGPAHTIIEDLNSTNGVLVNSRRITRQVLKDGDVVVIGKTQFRFAVRQSSERR